LVAHDCCLSSTCVCLCQRCLLSKRLLTAAGPVLRNLRLPNSRWRLKEVTFADAREGVRNLQVEQCTGLSSTTASFQTNAVELDVTFCWDSPGWLRCFVSEVFQQINGRFGVQLDCFSLCSTYVAYFRSMPDGRRALENIFKHTEVPFFFN
jgi:hypothetical protein